MITTREGVTSVNGTKAELVADLTAIFIALITRGYCPAITTALGIVLTEGGSALEGVCDDKNN